MHGLHNKVAEKSSCSNYYCISILSQYEVGEKYLEIPKSVSPKDDLSVNTGIKGDAKKYILHLFVATHHSFIESDTKRVIGKAITPKMKVSFLYQVDR